MALFKSQNSEPDNSNLLGYVVQERISGQWASFMLALSGELQAQLSSEQHRTLLVKVGQRFAQAQPISVGDTVTELTKAFNQIWQSQRWGYVRLTDEGNSLHIKHVLCPLATALAVDPILAGGFLEGAYQEWLQAAGAGRGLRVRQLQALPDGTTMEFRLGRQ